jgi:F-type H+-transporting ATPase subunit delta
MAAVDRRYAQALFELVLAGKADATKLNDELAHFAAALRRNPTLPAVLASPRVEPERKLKVVDQLVQRMGGSRFIRNLIAVTIDRGRIAQLEKIQQEFAELVRQRQGLVHADITSARALAADERAAIERELARVSGRKIDPTYRQDIQLLGGFIARIGDTIYDASIRGQLDRMRHALATEPA